MTGHPRRVVLRGALLGAAAVALDACTEAPDGPPVSPSTGRAGASSAPSGSAPSGNKVLLAYFSRAGENYYNGGRRWLEVGNTEVVAGMIRQLIDCDVHKIEPADPYPDEYEPTVQRNVRELRSDARPEIANPLDSIDGYDTVILGSPIWASRTPLIMTTFAEQFDFTGKTVFPLVTYAVSRMGNAVQNYTEACPGADLREGLAVRGEERDSASPEVEAWLRRSGLL